MASSAASEVDSEVTSRMMQMQLQVPGEGAIARVESIRRTPTAGAGAANTTAAPSAGAAAGDESDLLVDWPDDTASSSHDKTKSNGDSPRARSALRAKAENTSSEARKSGTASAARPRKSVHFSNEVRCKPIPYKTPAELQSVWYSSDERAELHGRTKKVVKRLRRRPMSEDELLASKNESMRGVEHLLSASTLRALQQEQRDVIDAVVLLQQHWRVKNRPFDARELAYTSHALSASASDRARQFGKADAEVTKDALPTASASVGASATIGEDFEADGSTNAEQHINGSDMSRAFQMQCMVDVMLRCR